MKPLQDYGEAMRLAQVGQEQIVREIADALGRALARVGRFVVDALSKLPPAQA